MAALPTTRMTLAELAKYMGPDGNVQPVVELLYQHNEGIWDVPWQPGNLPTGHEYTVRTKLPTAYLRDYNEGTAPSVSSKAKQTDGMSIIEAWSEIDKAEAKLNGNEDAYRAGEDAAFTQALEQLFAQLLIYGNAASNQKEFNGIATRLNALSIDNVIDASAGAASSGQLYTSIYLADWGADLFGIYPKGSMAGLQNVDHGTQILQFSDGTRMAALITQFIWDCGIACRDWRRIARIANILTTDLVNRANTQAINAATNIIYLMSDALYKLPKGSSGTKVFYCNRTVHAALAKIAMDRSQQVVTIEKGLTQFGHSVRWLSFLGVPIRCMDSILTTEQDVT